MHRDYEYQAYTWTLVNVSKCTSERVDGPSRSALNKTKDTRDWFNQINQRLPLIISIMTTSSDIRTLQSSPQKLATCIGSSKKPSKWRCILITSTELRVSKSADFRSRCRKDLGIVGILPTKPQWFHPHSQLYTWILPNRLCTHPLSPGHSPSIGTPTSLPEPCQV